MFKYKAILCIGTGVAGFLTLSIPLASGQTSVDLATQSRSVDFTAAPYTRPVKTGTVLPATCSVGDMFFNISNPSGTNLYGCTKPNIWTLQGSPGLNFTAESDGVPAGTESVADYTTGAGILTAITDTGSQLDIQTAVDTAVVQTLAGAQSGTALFCASSSNSDTVYECSMSPTLTKYSAGMTLHWLPDVNGLGGPTQLNIDSLGAIPVKRTDGATDPGAGDIIAGQLSSIWYDGTSFRLEQGAAVAGTIAAGDQINVSAGVVSYNPFDFSILTGRDDFCSFSPAVINSSQGLSSWMRWLAASVSGSLTVQATPNSLCGVQLVTGTSNAAYLSTSGGPAINPMTSANWKIYAIVSIPVIAQTGFSFSLGVSPAQQCSIAVSCLGISALPGTEDFQLNACASSTCSAVDTGIPVVAGTTYKMYLRAGTAGTVYASINGSSEVSVASNIPSVSYPATFYVAPTTASQSTLNILGFAYQTAGY